MHLKLWSPPRHLPLLAGENDKEPQEKTKVTSLRTNKDEKELQVSSGRFPQSQHHDGLLFRIMCRVSAWKINTTLTVWSKTNAWLETAVLLYIHSDMKCWLTCKYLSMRFNVQLLCQLNTASSDRLLIWGQISSFSASNAELVLFIYLFILQQFSVTFILKMIKMAGKQTTDCISHCCLWEGLLIHVDQRELIDNKTYWILIIVSATCWATFPRRAKRSSTWWPAGELHQNTTLKLNCRCFPPVCWSWWCHRWRHWWRHLSRLISSGG